MVGVVSGVLAAGGSFGFLVACLGDSCGFGRGLARGLGGECVEVFSKTFPDGEAYVRVEAEARGRVVVAVSPGFPEPSRRVVELMLLIEAVRGLGASGVIAFPLYLPYSRQDRRFLRGEPVSVRAVLHGLAASGADAFATVDVHKEYSLDWFPGPAANIDPSPVFAEALRGVVEGAETVYVIAPDRGALPRAHRLAERLGAAFDYLEKRRDRLTGEVSLKPRTLDVRGAVVVIVDDIVSTGGTLAKAARFLLEAGAERVYAAITHCLLAGRAVEKLESSGLERLYCGNTATPLSRWERMTIVDLSPSAVEPLRRLAERLYGYESEGPR